MKVAEAAAVWAELSLSKRKPVPESLAAFIFYNLLKTFTIGKGAQVVTVFSNIIIKVSLFRGRVDSTELEVSNNNY